MKNQNTGVEQGFRLEDGAQELIDEREDFERDEALREFVVEFGYNPEALEAAVAKRMGRGF